MSVEQLALVLLELLVHGVVRAVVTGGQDDALAGEAVVVAVGVLSDDAGHAGVGLGAVGDDVDAVLANLLDLAGDLFLGGLEHDALVAPEPLGAQGLGLGDEGLAAALLSHVASACALAEATGVHGVGDGALPALVAVDVAAVGEVLLGATLGELDLRGGDDRLGGVLHEPVDRLAGVVDELLHQAGVGVAKGAALPVGDELGLVDLGAAGVHAELGVDGADLVQAVPEHVVLVLSLEHDDLLATLGSSHGAGKTGVAAADDNNVGLGGVNDVGLVDLRLVAEPLGRGNDIGGLGRELVAGLLHAVLHAGNGDVGAQRSAGDGVDVGAVGLDDTVAQVVDTVAEVLGVVLAARLRDGVGHRGDGVLGQLAGDVHLGEAGGLLRHVGAGREREGSEVCGGVLSLGGAHAGGRDAEGGTGQGGGLEEVAAGDAGGHMFPFQHGCFRTCGHGPYAGSPSVRADTIVACRQALHHAATGMKFCAPRLILKE